MVRQGALQELTPEDPARAAASGPGTLSSWRLEEDIAFWMLAAGNFPRHRTLCEFRRRHLDDFGVVFAEMVRLARGMGLAGLGRVSVDGTKVRANASKRKAMHYGRMVREERRLRAEIAELLEKAEAVDAEEDARYGEDVRGDELPKEAAREPAGGDRGGEGAGGRAEGAPEDARARKPGQKRNPKKASPTNGPAEPQEKAQSNFTDRESWIMRTSTEGYQQCYNAQTVVDGECPLVAAAVMAEKLATDEGRRRYARPQVDGGGAYRLDQVGDGLLKIQLPGSGEGPGGVDSRAPA